MCCTGPPYTWACGINAGWLRDTCPRIRGYLKRSLADYQVVIEEKVDMLIRFPKSTTCFLIHAETEIHKGIRQSVEKENYLQIWVVMIGDLNRLNKESFRQLSVKKRRW